jgi:fatty acid desaturase
LILLCPHGGRSWSVVVEPDEGAAVLVDERQHQGAARAADEARRRRPERPMHQRTLITSPLAVVAFAGACAAVAGSAAIGCSVTHPPPA